MQQIGNSAWARHVVHDIAVRNGVVDLYGMVTDPKTALAGSHRPMPPMPGSELDQFVAQYA